ncbi:hypothetical protein [Saccharibacillus kuerlensis]|uniref:DUF4233 domain-containing protein n=1 Tax=Saccharibacillus kuerlensis TaxID=459527 RepID=A0ABQ2L3L8_9BACL|nr:hypothetical protein [Saccharibacillus kuerlensis]GGO00876.1 hypothetical protein GCM10010969_22570 [Saccharibacillus kuerlensis]
MSISRVLLLIAGVCELLLAIPVLGGWFVLATGWGVLGFMFLLHAAALVFTLRERVPFYGPVLGIITSLLAWIPFIGWALHLASGIALLVNAFQGPRTDTRGVQQRRYY